MAASPPAPGEGHLWLQAELTKPGQPDRLVSEPAPGQAADIVAVDAF